MMHNDDQFITKKIQKVVSNVEITVKKLKQLDKSKVPSIKYPYSAKLFSIFCFEIEIHESISDFLLMCVTNITLVLMFMKSNKFYDVRTAKVVNSKDVVCLMIKVCPW